MGYHSADYDKDWTISSAELARVLYLSNAMNGAIKTGCYKVDNSSIDGFEQDTNRKIDEPVNLIRYHSADYNKDGRIDEADYNRVAQLSAYYYTVVSDSSHVVTGQYHDNDPFSIDGFGLGPISLSGYDFDVAHLPAVQSKTPPAIPYALMAKFISMQDGVNYQAATTLNNNGVVIDNCPPVGQYDLELYWVQYSPYSFPLSAINIGQTQFASATVGADEKLCLRSMKDCICGCGPSQA